MNEHDKDLLDRLMLERNPLGFSAIPGSPLARARVRAHQQFDALWRRRHMSRKAAYKWLSRRMHLHPNECHFLLFDIDHCEEAIRLCRRKILELGKAE